MNLDKFEDLIRNDEVLIKEVPEGKFYAEISVVEDKINNYEEVQGEWKIILNRWKSEGRF